LATPGSILLQSLFTKKIESENRRPSMMSTNETATLSTISKQNTPSKRLVSTVFGLVAGETQGLVTEELVASGIDGSTHSNTGRKD
jgi:hypothetical protein